jgi:ABC-type uncharacterized transport system substrate-binding protein
MLVPQAGVIALLVNPSNAIAEVTIRDVQEAARAKGVQLQILRAGTEAEIDSAFAALVQLRAGALVAASDPFFNSRREQLVALASHHAVPAIWEWREFAEAGVEGQNVAIEYRSAEDRYDRLPALAADLVDSKVDVIATGGLPLALAAKSATSTVSPTRCGSWTIIEADARHRQ